MLNFLNYVFVIFFKTTSLNIILEMHFFVHNIFDLWIILTYFTYLSFIVNICQNPFFATIILIGKNYVMHILSQKSEFLTTKNYLLCWESRNLDFIVYIMPSIPSKLLTQIFFFHLGFVA